MAADNHRRDNLPVIWSPTAEPSEDQAFITPSQSSDSHLAPNSGDYIKGRDVDISDEDEARAAVLSNAQDISAGPPAKLIHGALHFSEYQWLPYSLRLPYLFSLFLTSITLCLVVLFLTYRSWLKHGLGDDNGTSALLFGWRFTPTLVAVLFVVLETILLNDVKRTEVITRLSNRTGISPLWTILKAPGFWWNDPIDSLGRKKNGGRRSKVLFYAAIMNITGSFILSPLSAAFLSSDPVETSVATQFATLPSMSKAGSPGFTVNPDDQTYFRSVAALILNLTTSVWLMDDYAIMPFWVASLTTPPLGATIPVEAQNWIANTTIFQSGLTCQPMSMTDLKQASFQLSSDDGCTLGVTVSIPLGVNSLVASYNENAVGPPILDAPEIELYYPLLNEGAWWVPTSIDGPGFSTSPDDAYNLTELINVSPQCMNRNILAVSSTFNVSYYPINGNYSDMNIENLDIVSNTSLFNIKSYICSTNYSMATIPVNVSINSLGADIDFNRTAFGESKTAISAEYLNVSSFETAFFSNAWFSKINTIGKGTFLGPATVLGTEYDYDVNRMLRDDLITSKAQHVQQRFLGESLLAAFSKASTQSVSMQSGASVSSKERIVASFGIGITLAAILLCTSIMVTLVYYHSRLSRRPLNIDRDPGSAAAISSLLRLSGSRSYFQGLDRAPDTIIRRRLEDLSFKLKDGGLVVDDFRERTARETITPLKSNSYSKDWRPVVLHTWTGWSLLLTISSLIVGLSVLFAKSRKPGLDESGFVYQYSLSLNNHFITSLAPYSILPTLIAVVLKFWWGALEDACKRLQPYVSMVRTPVSLSAGPALSYSSSPPVWSVWKSVRNKHWFLALICTGTVLMEVFTVGMSALWQRHPANLQTNIILSRGLKLRDVPQIFNVTIANSPDDGDATTAEILDQLYGNSQNLLSWMYGSVIQLAYAGSSPPWTYGDWSFTPVNLTDSSKASKVESGINDPTNITLNTFGLRGRLECTNVDMSNQSNWLTTWDLTNGSFWNLSITTGQEKRYTIGYELGISQDEIKENGFLISQGTNLDVGLGSTFYADPSRVMCCANDTNGDPGLAILGYWSPIGNLYDLSLAGGQTAQEVQDPGTTNFTVKWIVGKPFLDQWVEVGEPEPRPHYLWSEVPQVNVLNCAPIIEASNATVTVIQEEQVVVNQTIIGAPREYAEAWSDYYLNHNAIVNASAADGGPTISFGSSENITVSFGYLFMAAMLGAADWSKAQNASMWGFGNEPLNDRIFSFHMQGYNSDLMSYAIWSMNNGDISSLLDPDKLRESANTVFSTFFQHFVSEDANSGGGRAYQPLDYSLPSGFLPSINETAEEPTQYQDHNSSTVVSPTVYAVRMDPIYRLDMSITAVAICLAVLLFSGLTTVLICLIYQAYFKSLPRDVNTLASVFALVYDSPELLRWAAAGGGSEAHGTAHIKGDVNERKARLGYFKGRDGDTRWGIEIVEGLSKSSPVGDGGGDYELLDVNSGRQPKRRG